MKKPTKHTSQGTDQTGKTTNKSVSSSNAGRRTATSARQVKQDAKQNASPTIAPTTTTPQKATEKKHRNTKSSRTTLSRKENQVTQTEPTTAPIKTSGNQPRAGSNITRKTKRQTKPNSVSSKQNSETFQKDTARTVTDTAGSTHNATKPVNTATPIKESPQTEVDASVETQFQRNLVDNEDTTTTRPSQEVTEHHADTTTTPSQQQVTEHHEGTITNPPPQEADHYEPELQYMHPPLENKYLNKEALRNRLLLRQEFKPLIAYIGRLDSQKGVHLIRHGLFYALQSNAQFVLLGISPDPRINDEFWQLKHQLNENPDCHLELGFNEELSHLIYAGADMIIMPSLYEPCGLAQMIALKYGTVPIVRAVGGLVDTVFDRDYSDRLPHDRNGYVFHEPDAMGLESAMSRAIGLWYDYPEEFRQLMINGMKYDYSWNFPGQHYVNIYEYIRYK